MLLDRDKAASVFRKIKQIRAEMRAYCLAPDRFDLSIEDTQYVISAMYKIRIDKIEVNFEGVFIRGLIERYEERSLIIIKQNLENDRKRFVAVKELCHIAIDETEDWSSDGVKTIEDLLVEYEILDGDTAAQRASQSEMLAEIAAIELMYPYDLRQADAAKLANAATTLQKIANVHRMPEEIVSRALSKSYSAIAKRIWDEVGFG